MSAARSARAMVLVSLASLLFISGQSSGHLPIYKSGGSTIDDALHIPDIQVSYAIYAEFERGVGSHFYSFGAGAGEPLHFQMAVPTFDRFDGFVPEVLLIGPGLQPADADIEEVLTHYSVSLPPQTGVLRWIYDGPMYDEEFEPFTQTTFWVRQTVDTTLEVAGTYYFMIALPVDLQVLEDVGDDTTYKYLFAPGVEEDFGIVDFVLIPYDWYSTKTFWEENPLIFLLPTYVTVLGGLALYSYLPTRLRPGLRSGDRVQRILIYSALLGALLMIGGGLNQVIFLMWSPLFTESSIGVVVLILQSAAVVVGVVALKITVGKPGFSAMPKLLATSLIVTVALVIGAGFIAGPVLLLGASLVDSWRSAAPGLRRT